MTFHKHSTFAVKTTEAEIERLIFHMPTIADMATNDFAKSFAQSIVRQSRKRGWRPSPKQLPIMRNLVSDLFANGYDIGGDFDLIE